MSTLLPFLYEGLVILGICLLAMLAAVPARRRVAGEGALPRPAGACIVNLLFRMLRTLVVLAVTPLVLWLLQQNASGAAWLTERHSHVTAWWTFWIFVLALDAVEAALLEYHAWRGRACPVPRLLRTILRAVLVLLALFVILKTILGVDIAPLLASTALLTAVIGFALQGVLGNLLAGLSLHVTRSAIPGDWVSIDGKEGQVLDTNWRETRIRTVAGHAIIIPNSTVASATIHNMSQPDPLRRHGLTVGASYSDAPGDVITALEEAALEVPVVEREPAPKAILIGYMDFGINYQLRYWTRQYQNHDPIDGEVGRIIWYKFKRRGIEIPFPMSDKLLNDFMEVVYTQRRLESDDTQVRRMVSDLMNSEFGSRLMADENGHCLLNEEELGAVAKLMRRVRYAAGETLFRQGDAGDNCYVVTRGRLGGAVEFEAGVRGSEFEVKQGSVVGEMSLVTGLPRTATLAVKEDAELLEIPAAAFVRLLSLRPELPELLAKLVADRAARNRQAWEHLKAESATRVAGAFEQKSLLSRFLRLLGR